MTTSSGRTLNIFILNAKHLTRRIESITKIVQFIATQAKQKGNGKVNCSTMRIFDPDEIKANLSDYTGRASLDKNGDEYDAMLEPLSIEVLSNIQKHQHTWKLISANPDSEALNLVIEDDAVVLADHTKHVADTFEYMIDYKNDANWDIMFTGMAQDNTGDVTARRYETLYDKFIPSKEAYFINKKTASLLHSVWTQNKLTHSLRLQLSRYLQNNRGVKAMFLNRRMTLDGSKIGLHPTTIHRNNILVFNGDFMKLLQMYLQSEGELESKYNELRDAYKQASGGPIQSPDVSHMYGLVLFKMKRYDEAEEAFQRALRDAIAQQGLVNNTSEILNNAINIYQHLQNDIKSITSNPSKYEQPGVIPLVD